MKPKQSKPEYDSKAQAQQLVPDEILAAANQEPLKRPVAFLASYYSPAIHVLRQKGLTWEEVRDWLAHRGIEYSTQSLYAAHRRWLKSQPEEPK